jgi:hypothetical protein
MRIPQILIFSADRGKRIVTDPVEIRQMIETRRIVLKKSVPIEESILKTYLRKGP